MAKADLEFPVQGLHGKLHKDSTWYCALRLGKTVVSSYPKHKKPASISKHQHTLNTNFRQAVLATQAELADPVRRVHWQSLFNNQPAPRRYKILRNFVIAQIVRNLRPESAV